MKTFPIISLNDDHPIGKIELRDDIAEQIAAIALSTRSGFNLYPTVNISEKTIVSFCIENMPVLQKKQKYGYRCKRYD